MFFRGHVEIAAGSTPLPNDTGESRAPLLEEKARQFADDAKRMRRALALAALVHLAILLMTFPHQAWRPKAVDPEPRKVYVVQELRYKPPPAPPRQTRPKILTRRIPIPDPTPDDPEPIVTDIPAPKINLTDGIDFDFGIPEAPGTSGLGVTGEVLEIAGDVLPPVQIYAPQPSYTEEARQARIQGTVVLRTVIDETGTIVTVEVLKHLALGLSESAVDIVGTWRYEPATQNGTPVPVFMYVIVNFRLT